LKKKFALSFIVSISLLIGVTPVFAAYTHTLLGPVYPAGTGNVFMKLQTSFNTNAVNAFVTSTQTWNNSMSPLTGFLAKSSLSTTDTAPSQNGSNTVTISYEGYTTYLGIVYSYNSRADGRVIEVDMHLNNYYNFVNGAQPNKYDIQSLFTHELGHVLRIGHSTVLADTMYPSQADNDISYRDLTNADKEAAFDSFIRW